MVNNNSARVELVKQYASNGRYIRMATRVTLENGQQVTFTERLPKAQAIAQARVEARYERVRQQDMEGQNVG